MIINNTLKIKILIAFLVLFILLGSYVIYLNIIIIDLKEDNHLKNEIYNLQISNRINEIEQLNVQLFDLQDILNIGLDLSNKSATSLNNFDTSKITKDGISKLLNSIPSGSPLKKIFVTSKYGIRIHPISGVIKKHTGTDFKAVTGSFVYATADGIVSNSRNIDPGGYGKKIEIMHSYGFKTLYAHLDNVLVKKGDIIKKGKVIGLSGNTGNSTAEHLHYEIKQIDNLVDPINLVYLNKKTFNSIKKRNLKIRLDEMLDLEKERIRLEENR